MSPLTILILAFFLLGALDLLLGNRLGVGREFERAFALFAPMALSMLGMIVIAPAIGVWLTPLFDGFYRVFGLDPSILPASLLANDMGGMALAEAIARSEEIGTYNAFIVASMMGCLISFTLPFSLGLVKKEQHRELFVGILAGIATIPLGSFVGGLLMGISPLSLLLDLLPLLALGILVSLGLRFARGVCIACFSAFGRLMRLLSILGLVLAVFTFLTGRVVSPHFESFESAAFICANACVTLAGALPFMHLLTKLLRRPLSRLGAALGINAISALAFLGTLVTNASTFGMAERMDKRGMVLNSAFAVSASFVFGSHLAFTTVFCREAVVPMIVGKLTSGLCAVALALLITRRETKEETEPC